jgi:hypothetical protein
VETDAVRHEVEQDAGEVFGVFVEDRDRAVHIIERDDDHVIEGRRRRAEGEGHAVGVIDTCPRSPESAPG